MTDARPATPVQHHRTPITAIPSPRSRASTTKELQAAARSSRFRIIQPRQNADEDEEDPEELDDHGRPLPRPPMVVTVGRKKPPRILDAIAESSAPRPDPLSVDLARLWLTPADPSSCHSRARRITARTSWQRCRTCSRRTCRVRLTRSSPLTLAVEDAKAPPRPPSPSVDAVPIDDDEFVYDVYYRVTGPSAAAGLDPAGAGRIGALSGLVDDELDFSGRGDTDSDPAASDDEDSNGALRLRGLADRAEEDFYRNDYPEGEGESDDELPANGHRSGGSDYDLEYSYGSGVLLSCAAHVDLSRRRGMVRSEVSDRILLPLRIRDVAAGSIVRALADP